MRKANVPESEIRFAAKTGFLSKRLWEEFFAQGTPSWNRRVWKSFVTRELFRTHPSSMIRDVLVLHRKSLVVRSMVGEDISVAPIAWQFEHDETVARSLLFLSRAKIIQSFMTEAELKRLQNGDHRLENGSLRVKYPDAIVNIGGASRSARIALELELTRKEPKRYRQCLDAYASRRDVDRVIFIARAKLVADSLKRAMRETCYPDWERPIGFVHLDEWTKNPLMAPIEFGESRTTMAAIHQEMIA